MSDGFLHNLKNKGKNDSPIPCVHEEDVTGVWLMGGEGGACVCACVCV